MPLKRFYVIALFAIIVAGINCANEIKQHDIINADNREALGNVFVDTLSNMKILKSLNLTIKEIHLNDDSSVKFHNITFTPLSKEEKLDGKTEELMVECTLEEKLTVIIPLGFYKIKGSLQTTNNNEIYSFEVSLRNVEANFTVYWIPQITQEIDILIRNVAVAKLNENVVTPILHNQVPAIKSQILDQLYAQIKKEDLLSYFTTAKNYCFHSQSQVDPTKQYYQINPRYSLVDDKFGVLIVKWIKIKNLYFNFKLEFDLYNQTIDYYFTGKNNYEFTFHGQYVGNYRNPKNATEYSAKLNVELIRREQQPAKPWCTTEPEVWIVKDNETDLFIRQYELKLSNVISKDLDSYVGEKYEELTQTKKEYWHC